MAILDFTGFETGDPAEIPHAGLAVVGPGAAGRSGAYCAEPVGDVGWARLAVAAAEEHRLGFGLRLGALPAARREVACAVGVGSLRVEVMPTGQLVLVDTGSEVGDSGGFLLPAGEWVYLELAVRLPAAGSRSAELWVEGMSRATATLTGVQGPLAALYVGRIGVHPGALDARFDDLYSESDPAPEARGGVAVSPALRVTEARPGGGFTGGAGAVDDWPGVADGDATYVAGSGTGRFGKASAVGSVPPGESLLALKAVGLVRAAAGVVSAGVGLARDAAEEYQAVAVGGGYAPLATVFPTAFADGGAAWTPALADDYDLLLAAGAAARCTALAVLLLHTGAAEPGDPGGPGGPGDPDPGGETPGTALVRRRSRVRRAVRLRCEVE